MKSVYFTPETLEQKALDFYKHAESCGQGRTVRFKPLRSALLVLDMQAFFLEASSHAYIPSSRAILPGIRNLVSVYAQRRLPVFFTRHVNTPDNAGLMATWWRDLITADNPLSALSAELDVSAGLIIEKSQYDAFYQTSLEENLRQRRILQVVICGLMTHLCCETTARSAFMRGFEVFFLVDGTATTSEGFHRASLRNLSHGFVVPRLVQHILSCFRRQK